MTAFIRLCRIPGMSEDGELSFVTMLKCTAVGDVFARDFGGLFAELGYEKKNSRKSPKIRNHRNQKEAVLFSWVFARWCQAQAEDDQL